ncbi:MAG TPA: pyridoxal-phosphate dependent enzyme [Polyangiaceae bacterium]|jgi:cystathionine beta-synthase|nr:pyridoxal-phosphate dependent enzyme [Polyangiaceae bacterium]
MMRSAKADITQAVGNTPIVKLNRVTEGLAASIYVKCEYLNPMGSHKDRVARNMVAEAEARGLKPGGTIVEATSGNTGAALAMMAAIKGYKTVFIMPDKMSQEKVSTLRALGARVVLCPTAVEPEDPRSYYQVAKRIANETPNCFYANQYHNPDNPGAHYKSTGPEIWEQCGPELDVLVAGLGTGGTISGTGKFLKERKPGIKLVGVDPVGSLYFDFIKDKRITKPFGYKVEGIGEDFFPSTINLDIIDDVVRVDDKECFLMTRDLVRLEGLFVGGSSGAAVAGAIKYAKATGRKENILVMLADGASKYISKIFNDDWMRENGFLDEGGPSLGTVRDLLGLRGGPIQKVETATSTDSIVAVVEKLKAFGISQLPVVDDGRLKGLIHESDLLKALVSGKTQDSTIEQMVESDYATVTQETKVELLKNVLNDAKVALVMDGASIVGVISKIDMIDFLSRRASAAA